MNLRKLIAGTKDMLRQACPPRRLPVPLMSGRQTGTWRRQGLGSKIADFMGDSGIISKKVSGSGVLDLFAGLVLVPDSCRALVVRDDGEIDILVAGDTFGDFTSAVIYKRDPFVVSVAPIWLSSRDEYRLSVEVELECSVRSFGRGEARRYMKEFGKELNKEGITEYFSSKAEPLLKSIAGRSDSKMLLDEGSRVMARLKDSFINKLKLACRDYPIEILNVPCMTFAVDALPQLPAAGRMYRTAQSEAIPSDAGKERRTDLILVAVRNELQIYDNRSKHIRTITFDEQIRSINVHGNSIYAGLKQSVNVYRRGGRKIYAIPARGISVSSGVNSVAVSSDNHLYSSHSQLGITRWTVSSFSSMTDSETGTCLFADICGTCSTVRGVSACGNAICFAADNKIYTADSRCNLLEIDEYDSEVTSFLVLGCTKYVGLKSGELIVKEGGNPLVKHKLSDMPIYKLRVAVIGGQHYLFYACGDRRINAILLRATTIRRTFDTDDSAAVINMMDASSNVVVAGSFGSSTIYVFDINEAGYSVSKMLLQGAPVDVKVVPYEYLS